MCLLAAKPCLKLIVTQGRNDCGDTWTVEIDGQNKVGMLRGSELDPDESIEILDGVVTSDLILTAEELDWLADCWQRATDGEISVTSTSQLDALLNAFSSMRAK